MDLYTIEMSLFFVVAVDSSHNGYHRHHHHTTSIATCQLRIYCEDFFSVHNFWRKHKRIVVPKNIIYARWKSSFRHLSALSLSLSLVFASIDLNGKEVLHLTIFLDSSLASSYYILCAHTYTKKSSPFINIVSCIFFCG